MRQILERLKLPVLPHVWLGTSVESADFKWRIKELQKVAATVRFISFEPLISDIGAVDLAGIHWAIVGGESGPKARPIEQKWVEKLQRSCAHQGTAFFFKQWGGTNKKAAGRELNGRTWDEYPRSIAVMA